MAMDDSPRASKRRKLDTPSPSATTGTARKSGRLAKTNGTGRRQTVAENADLWDDIEGALGDSPVKPATPKPLEASKKRLPREEGRHDTARTASRALHSPKTTPGRARRKTAATAESAPSASTRKLRGAQISNEPCSPSQGSLRKLSASARKHTGPEIEEATVIPTSSPRSTRARQPRHRAGSTIPETDDELAHAIAASSRAASARRREHRADHTNNQREQGSDLDLEELHAAAEEAGGDGMSVDGNSAVGSLLDPTEPSPFNKPASTQKEHTAIPLLSGFVEPGSELDLLKTIVLERISGKRSAPLVGLDDEYKSVHQLVEHTVTAGEGNSMLLIGARGSGKTALVSKVLSDVSKDNSQDYHVVRLNGFIHTDDKIALREIWRQLGKEMDLDEEGGGVGKNYADTLATLLALLSHPSEQTGEMTDQVAKAVVFIMDEFDLFALHPRQTLLYNLFDIAQSRKAPIAVLGLTTRIDVANSLEKRVKSRFSHRYVHLSLAKTFTAFQEICKANLLVQPELLSVQERSILESVARKKAGNKGNKGADGDPLSQWNSNIHTLFASKAFLTTHLAPLFYRSKSIPTALTTFLLPTATLSTSLSLLSAPLTTPPDSKLTLVPHLSTLALSLLIAAARLDIIHDSDTCNFNMAYDEYVTLASKARIQSAAGGTSASGSMAKVWGKEVARREWEALVGLGLVVPVVGGLPGGFGMVRVDVALEEVGAVLGGEKGIEKGLGRWCRQL